MNYEIQVQIKKDCHLLCPTLLASNFNFCICSNSCIYIIKPTCSNQFFFLLTLLDPQSHPSFLQMTERVTCSVTKLESQTSHFKLMSAKVKQRRHGEDHIHMSCLQCGKKSLQTRLSERPPSPRAFVLRFPFLSSIEINNFENW